MTSLIKRGTLADQVAEAILALITERGLGPGDPLPATAELGELFGVSRTVVREAFADLAGRGVVDRGQGRESVITTPGTDQLQGIFGFHLQKKLIDGDQLTEVRLAIEVMSARLAADRRTDSDVDELRAAVAAMAGASSEVPFHEADIAFHQLLAKASRNSLIELMLDSLVGLMREFRELWFAGQKRHHRTFKAVADEHQTILAAVILGDGDAAAAAMQAHLTASGRDLAATAAKRRRSG